MQNHYIIISEVKNAFIFEDKILSTYLKNIITVINKIHKNDFITNLELMPPNEIQGISNNLQKSLEIIFDIEECIIENNLTIKLKHVLYQNKMELVKSKYTAFEQLGMRLIDARQQLNSVKKTDSRFLMITQNEQLSLELNNLFLIYADYIDSWKKADFEMVTAFLNNRSYKEVATLFNMNTSSGWRREKSLKLKQYYTVKEMILNTGEL